MRTCDWLWAGYAGESFCEEGVMVEGEELDTAVYCVRVSIYIAH